MSYRIRYGRLLILSLVSFGELSTKIPGGPFDFKVSISLHRLKVTLKIEILPLELLVTLSKQEARTQADMLIVDE
jgi:hypothetical protein